jgi:hypothetical protein
MHRYSKSVFAAEQLLAATPSNHFEVQLLQA